MQIIFQLYFSFFHFAASSAVHVRRLHTTPGGLTLAGVSQRLGRERTMMLPTRCQSRTRPRWRQTAC